jgi:hypothetical protein
VRAGVMGMGRSERRARSKRRDTQGTGTGTGGGRLSERPAGAHSGTHGWNLIQRRRQIAHMQHALQETNAPEAADAPKPTLAEHRDQASACFCVCSEL